jgi:hypothetical protein
VELNNSRDSYCTVPSHQTMHSWHEKETYVNRLHICIRRNFCIKTAESSFKMLRGVKAHFLFHRCLDLVCDQITAIFREKIDFYLLSAAFNIALGLNVFSKLAPEFGINRQCFRAQAALGPAASC